MNELVIILAAILPAIVLAFNIWIRDTHPEPMLLLLKAALYGALVSIPILIVESALQIVIFGESHSATTLIGTTIDSFIIAALTEEAFKLFALWWLLCNNPNFDEHIDGIVYAVFVGLGFAMVENILYLFGNHESWQSVAFIRALFAVPAHYAFAVLMGYYYSLYHFVQRSKGNLMKTLLVPVLAHGLYDAIAMGIDMAPAIATIGTSALILLCFKMQIYAKKQIDKMVDMSDGDF